MTEITIQYESVTQTINLDGEHFVEELSPYGWRSSPTVRVWHDDPEHDDSEYTDYQGASITEVSP
jgi:hypothetical protein